MTMKVIPQDSYLWERERPLWELAQESREQAMLSVDCPNANGLIHPLVMSNPCVKGALFGPPDRVTLTLKKTDIWERRIQEIMPDGQRRLDAKSVGRMTFLADDGAFMTVTAEGDRLPFATEAGNAYQLVRG